jgi:hypothetical protein
MTSGHMYSASAQPRQHLLREEEEKKRKRTFRPNKRVRPKVRNATLRIDERHSIRRHHFDACWSTSETGRVGLLGEVEVGKHDVASFMEEDVCADAKGASVIFTLASIAHAVDDSRNEKEKNSESE